MEQNKSNVVPKSKQILSEIMSSSLADLKKANTKAYDIILNANDGDFFINHQTKGNMDRLALKLLETIEGNGEKDNENK